MSAPSNVVDQMAGAPVLKAFKEHKVLISALLTWTTSSTCSVMLLRQTGAAFDAPAPRAVLTVMLNGSLFLTLCVGMVVAGHANVLKAILVPVAMVNVVLIVCSLLALLISLISLIPLPYLLSPIVFIAVICFAENPAYRKRAIELLEELESFAVMKLWPCMVANPVTTLSACTWLASSFFAWFALYLTGAAFYAPLPRIVLGLMLFGCFLLTLAVWWRTSKITKMAPVEEKLITPAPQKEKELVPEASKAWKMPSSLASIRSRSMPSIPAMQVPAVSRLKTPEISSSMKRTLRNTTLSAAGGAVALGAGGGVVGLTAGSAVGAAVGIVPALFTFGLSIPIGAVIGGSVGCITGSAMGGTAGAVGGGTAGLAYTRFTKEKQ